MQKQAPSIGRILVAIGFALSCFGLILFLWIAFGGPIPLKPKSYEITAYFPEATQLATESDVRIGGVSVGKVKTIELAPEDKRVHGQDTTQATIEIDPQFAPINSDARAILRQKTLLGETYVELTAGTKPGTGPPGGKLRATPRRARTPPRPRRCRWARPGAAPRRRPRTCARSRRAAAWVWARPRTPPRSTRSSTPSTSGPGPPSGIGRRTRPSPSTAAAST